MVKSIFKKFRLYTIFCILLIIEFTLILFLIPFFSTPVNGYSNGTVVVKTSLQVTQSAPEVVTVVVTNASNSYTNFNITGNPGTGKTIYCNGIVRDWSNNTFLTNISARLYQNTSGQWDSDDNNTHYTNSSCSLNLSTYDPVYGDDSFGNYTANYSCSFNFMYYANPGTWNCSVVVYNNFTLNNTNENTTVVGELLGLTLPTTIDYGSVNSTFVSNENITNVSNAGNVAVNLTLQGYAFYVGDGQAMNCSKGTVKNISIMYEKYNLTTSNPGVLALTDIETLYTNLTGGPITKKFNLNYRQAENWDDATNATYWRIYVPRGVAGTCSGNIVFGAIKSAGS